jgi:F-type H+-transporting ATPase subunit delta
MSQATTLARPYARALFALAKQASQLSAVSGALNFSSQACLVPELSVLLGNPRIAKHELLALLSPADSNEILQRFLQVLAENNRLALLPDIFVLFEQLRAESERVVNAKITSATALSDAELNKLSAALKKRFGRDVEMQTAVDEALIGGAIIDTGDLVIDGSVRNKLARLSAGLTN